MSVKRVILEFFAVGSGSDSSFSLLFHHSQRSSVYTYYFEENHRIQLEQNQSGPSPKLVKRTVTESWTHEVSSPFSYRLIILGGNIDDQMGQRSEGQTWS